jgi:hypothetical protein
MIKQVDYLLEGGRDGVLLIHGLTGDSGGNALCRQGFAAAGLHRLRDAAGRSLR